MKRILIAALLCVVLLLTACASQQENPERDAKKIAEISASLRLPTYDTKEEYDAFMAGYGNKLPKSFVTWEELSSFGEFCALVLLGEDRYLYKVVDETGIDISIDVDPSPEATAKAIIPLDSVSIIGSDYREVAYDYEGDVDFIVQRNGVDYCYKRGNNKLRFINFYIDGVEITITMTGGLSAYPVGRTDTVVGKLLSADDATAKAAITEINRKLG